MDEKDLRPAYWAVIPADVRYCDAIPANAKLLYGEISALCNRRGFCWAKNEYFSQLFGWSVNTVSRLLGSLKKEGFVDVDTVPIPTGSERRIYAGVYPGGLTNFGEGGGTKNGEGGSPKMVTPSPRHNITKNNITEYTPIPPCGGGVGKCGKPEPKDAPDWKPDRFAGFWKFYPAKGRKDKQRAIRAWDKLKPDDELIAQIGRSLQKLKATEEYQRGIGIPYVSTFLNGQRWHDADELTGTDEGDVMRAEDFGWQT